MALPTQPYKGTRDFYPEDKRVQKYMFGRIRQVVESFGYHEYDAPILEPLDIYLAKTGEEIINDQLYSFTDKGGRALAIRPEMTPSASRMVAARRQELAYPARWYSIPNLWRYERPQRGRLREHWQLNVDIFGVADISADHEIILVSDSILKAFGAKPESYAIRINSRQLLNHFLKDVLKLDEKQCHDAFKLMDRAWKVEKAEVEAIEAEILPDEKTRREFDEILAVKKIADLPDSLRGHPAVEKLNSLFKMLDVSGVQSAVFDISVIRGMDYYDDIVFEVFDANPENNRSMFGGGRYDGLVGLFGVEPVPTVGFGMGDVTLQNFLEAHDLLPQLPPEADAVAILVGDVYGQAQGALSELRDKGINIAVDSSGRKLDMQLKHAIKSGARWALFIGEEELSSGQFKLRDLEKGEEKQLSLDQIAESLKK